MKKIEKIKLIFGLILTSFAILGGLIFFLESFNIFNHLLDYGHLSQVFRDGGGANRDGWHSVSFGGGASNAPIFLGLCGLSGTFLLNSLPKTVKENKTIITPNVTEK